MPVVELADAEQPGRDCRAATSDTPIVIDRRTICTTSAPPGQRASSIWFSAAATQPIAPAAAVILANAPRMRPSLSPCRWRRRTTSSVTALNSAAIEVPSASPRNPKHAHQHDVERRVDQHGHRR